MSESTPISSELRDRWPQGQVISIPFYENEKCVVGQMRSGGMGSVFQLIPLSPLKRVLALKTYRAGIDPTVFAREAKIWISLGEHPNIARALSYGLIEDVPCILATWCDRNLVDVDPHHHSVDRLLSLTEGIIYGLQYAYERLQLVHKDIKPGNILIDSEGNPRLSDFGISAYTPVYVLNQGLPTTPFDDAKSEGRRAMSGTPRYMAPELFNGAPASVQSDIYSLGVTLFEWLMGRHPYITEDGALRFSPGQAVKSKVMASFGKEAKHLASMIASAIDPNPDDRPTSYEVLLQMGGVSRQSAGTRKRPSISDIAATARLLREQGNTEAAKRLLDVNLQTAPSDPVLLNAYGALLVTQGKHREASVFFLKSVESDRAARANQPADPYPDPYLNLANLYRNESKFSAAAKIIRESRQQITGVFELLAQERWEYAWLELLEGNVDAARNQIMTYLFRSGISEPALSIFLVSAYLSGDMAGSCNKCFDLISHAGRPSLAECQHLCIIGTYLDAIRRHRLVSQILGAESASLLRKVGERIANDPDLFHIPMRSDTIAAVIRGIDAEYTGGKYCNDI